MALFGEKYGATVRTVTVPSPEDVRYSYELCGGTHVLRTGDIGPFVIVKEESSSAGVRRVTAVTGHAAFDLINERFERLNAVAAHLRSEPELVVERVDSLQDELKEAHKALEELSQSQAGDVVEDLMGKARTHNGATLLLEQVTASDGDMLSWMVDRCREHIQSGVVVLGAEIDGGVRLVAKVTPDMIEKGIKAGDIIREIAPLVDGRGGGRPEFAQAGGKNPAGLTDAMQRAAEIVQQAL